MSEVTLYLRGGSVVDVMSGTSRLADIAVDNERILAVGAGDELTPLIGERTVVVELSGKTIVPGLIDDHVHLMSTGLMLQELDLDGTGTVSEVLELVAAEAKKQPRGTLIRGWRLQENLLAENRFPTMKELDGVAPRHYVQLIRADGHSSTVNGLTLRYLGYDTGLAGVESEGGTPTGVLRGEPHYQALLKVGELAPPESRRMALEKACAAAIRVGLTSIQCLEGGRFSSEDDVLAVMAAGPELPVRTLVWYQTTDIARVKELGLPRIGGCILVDGAPGSYTGALFEPYADNPSTNGLLYFTDEDLNAFVLAAHRGGFQIAMHATCQRAIEQLLRAYEHALDVEPKSDHRFRVEHCYGLPTADQFERMGRRAVICSTQPAFLHYRLDMYRRRFGHRWPQVHPHRLALEHGVTIAGGSDSFVTPMYPLLGIHCAVNHPVEGQRVTVAEALRWFTINAAYAVFEEADKGSIAPGKLADFVVLGQDILTIESKNIKDIPIDLTIVGGRVRYRRNL